MDRGIVDNLVAKIAEQRVLLNDPSLSATKRSVTQGYISLLQEQLDNYRETGEINKIFLK